MASVFDGCCLTANVGGSVCRTKLLRSWGGGHFASLRRRQTGSKCTARDPYSRSAGSCSVRRQFLVSNRPSLLVRVQSENIEEYLAKYQNSQAWKLAPWGEDVKYLEKRKQERHGDVKNIPANAPANVRYKENSSFSGGDVKKVLFGAAHLSAGQHVDFDHLEWSSEMPWALEQKDRDLNKDGSHRVSYPSSNGPAFVGEASFQTNIFFGPEQADDINGKTCEKRVGGTPQDTQEAKWLVDVDDEFVKSNRTEEVGYGSTDLYPKFEGDTYPPPDELNRGSRWWLMQPWYLTEDDEDTGWSYRAKDESIDWGYNRWHGSLFDSFAEWVKFEERWMEHMEDWRGGNEPPQALPKGSCEQIQSRFRAGGEGRAAIDAGVPRPDALPDRMWHFAPDGNFGADTVQGKRPENLWSAQQLAMLDIFWDLEGRYRGPHTHPRRSARIHVGNESPCDISRAVEKYGPGFRGSGFSFPLPQKHPYGKKGSGMLEGANSGFNFYYSSRLDSRRDKRSSYQRYPSVMERENELTDEIAYALIDAPVFSHPWQPGLITKTFHAGVYSEEVPREHPHYPGWLSPVFCAQENHRWDLDDPRDDPNASGVYGGDTGDDFEDLQVPDGGSGGGIDPDFSDFTY